MRVLFLTRKHPPSVGGMQRVSYHLITEMKPRAEVIAVTWGGSQVFLPLFLPYALVKSVVVGRDVDLVHAGDAVMASVGWILGKLLNAPVVVTVHGLDITLPFKPYQWFIPRLLRDLDHVVCVSNSTLKACERRRIPPEKCTVIHNGVSVPAVTASQESARRQLSQILQRDIHGERVLLTVGRLVRRKGVHWFTERVLPRVLAADPDVRYVVVGSGPMASDIRSVASHPSVSGKVHLLGRVSDHDLDHLYAAADLFIMPNLPVPGDMEGFGLVALEAAAHGLPVLAADLEGIRDAVIPEQTGWLLEPGEIDSWVSRVLEALDDPDSLRRMGQLGPATARQRFAWKNMVDAYEDLFRRLTGSLES